MEGLQRHHRPDRVRADRPGIRRMVRAGVRHGLAFPAGGRRAGQHRQQGHSGDPAGHPDRVEGQSRQRVPRGRGRRACGRHLGGVGYELLQQQQLFDMAGALAWTLQLVFFVLIAQAILTQIETVAFRYRAVSERAL